MTLTILDLYKNVLPKTNCGECGSATCLAFANTVVAEKQSIGNCPYLSDDIVADYDQKLQAQYAAGTGLKKDPAKDALQWAKERSASMAIEDLPSRIGGELIEREGEIALSLPYFNQTIAILPDRILARDGSELNMWEQVFIYNHMAQNGSSLPSGVWKGFAEFPNTVSKVKSMVEHVERPLINAFKGDTGRLIRVSKKIGGIDQTGEFGSSDAAILFHPLPRVPVMLMFWDEEGADGFGAELKLLFDKTAPEHLDIESILFLSERLRQLLCEEAPPKP
jgi:hypothetical protein